MCKHQYYAPDERPHSEDAARAGYVGSEQPAPVADGATRRLGPLPTEQPTQRFPEPAAQAPYQGNPQEPSYGQGYYQQRRYSGRGYGRGGGYFPGWGLLWLIWPLLFLFKALIPFAFMGYMFSPHAFGGFAPFVLLFLLFAFLRAVRPWGRGWGGGGYGRRRW